MHVKLYHVSESITYGFQSLSIFKPQSLMLLRPKAVPGTLKGTLGICDLTSSQQQRYLLRTVRTLHTSPYMLFKIPQENS